MRSMVPSPPTATARSRPSSVSAASGTASSGRPSDDGVVGRAGRRRGPGLRGPRRSWRRRVAASDRSWCTSSATAHAGLRLATSASGRRPQLVVADAGVGPAPGRDGMDEELDVAVGAPQRRDHGAHDGRPEAPEAGTDGPRAPRPAPRDPGSPRGPADAAARPASNCGLTRSTRSAPGSAHGEEGGGDGAQRDERQVGDDEVGGRIDVAGGRACGR